MVSPPWTAEACCLGDSLWKNMTAPGSTCGKSLDVFVTLTALPSKCPSVTTQDERCGQPIQTWKNTFSSYWFQERRSQKRVHPPSALNWTLLGLGIEIPLGVHLPLLTLQTFGHPPFYSSLSILLNSSVKVGLISKGSKKSILLSCRA